MHVEKCAFPLLTLFDRTLTQGADDGDACEKLLGESKQRLMLPRTLYSGSGFSHMRGHAGSCKAANGRGLIVCRLDVQGATS